MKILHLLILKGFNKLKTMSSIFTSYYDKYKYNPSVNKRPYNNGMTTSSKPMSNSIKKDPKMPDSLYTKSNMQSPPSLYYVNQSNSKQMINSYKDQKTDIYDKN
jgi:hypothetical protein